MAHMLHRKVKRVHFTAIGGIGMSGIAAVLRTLGFEVSGSDLKESENTAMLAAMGAAIYIGHKAEYVRGADVVVYSSAVSPNNPEMIEARAQGIPLIPRAEMLAELMRMKSGLAVAGSHGKTTTTSLLSWILGCAGMDPTFVVGGRMATLGTNARLGQGEYFIVEADESDGSFLKFSPVLSVVTNIDAEHLDYYHDFENVKAAFVAFMNKVPFYGAVVVCLDDVHIQSVLPRVMRPLITYGFNRQARYRADNLRRDGVRTTFDVSIDDKAAGEFVLHQPGDHNVQNALAALAAATELDVPLDVIRQAMESFKGVGRRFEFKGEAGGVQVVDDYGHHPREIVASLRGARQSFPDRRLVALFQPHRYTRVRDHFDEFAAAFHDADLLVLTDIYPASEEPIEGVDSQRLFEAIRQRGHRAVQYVPDKRAIPAAVVDQLEAGDILISFGAGDINRYGMETLALLQRRQTAKEA